MLITIDTTKDDAATVRVVIGFLAHLYKLEPSEVEVPEGTTAPVAVILPTIPAPSNVINFPVPPPPPTVAAVVTSAATADVPALNLTAAPSVVAASAPSGVASAAVTPEYDSAGMPFDGRIHQKAKGQKKDGTWKLIKGIDPAVVQAVTVELAARKIATPASPSAAVLALQPAQPGVIAVTSVPPPPPVVGAVPPPPATVAPQVSLPEAYNGNPVPVPPVPSTAPVEAVSAPTAPAGGVVPVPPVASAGPVGVTYRTLIDKMTAGTKAQTLTAAKVLQIVQDCGCPNLQQLNQMPAIWPDVDARLELALAGL